MEFLQTVVAGNVDVKTPPSQTIHISPITAAPETTYLQDLRRRDDSSTIGSATCGWVNGDEGEPDQITTTYSTAY
jgi:hypothetical protein